ncbi:DoxX family protein [Brevundimonas balnearis]|uniref:DoxX family protein n=1 Tax=Brevundimonas balnearis TaxID=1572858 RepID=A0ABV6R1X7_9CAUL
MRALNASNLTTTPRRARLRATQINMALWTFQGWLAMFFTAAGYAKLTEPMANLEALLGWAEGAPAWLVRGTGGLEIVVGLLVLAPLASWKLGRTPMLAAAAMAAALSLIMFGVHLMRLEWAGAVVNAALFALAATVVKGRSV